MSPLVESIKLKDGCLCKLEYHNQRLNRSMQELFPGSQKIDLHKLISLPEECNKGVFKVRVVYWDTIQKIEISPYQYRKIESLKIVHHESIDYHLKSTNREILNKLYNQRGDCDDIIIVKKGCVGDSFAANLLFFDGDKWVTPNTPLLKGTQRQYLLEKGTITEKTILEKDILLYQKIGLVNAMVDIDEMPVVSIHNVKF